MIKLIENGVFLSREQGLVQNANVDVEKAKDGTIAWKIMSKHNSGTKEALNIKFDALASHDITYVGIIQTARASGLEKFPVPYVLTNCHNSLCAVGGTINEDDHVFGLSAAKKYGGIFVPAHQAVIHSYVREMLSGCGKMILGSDSHTRYGGLGTMGFGEGGPELVKQILGKTYDVARPEVVAIYLEGKPVAGVGPQDVALAIIGAVFKNGFVKNRIMEFVGPGVKNLSAEFRNGVDVMTTETTCLSSIWQTDDKIKNYYAAHGRPEAYAELLPDDMAYYDRAVVVDLGKVKPMIALPFHPSNAYTIEEFNENTMDILAKCEQEAISIIDNPAIKYNLRDKVIDGRLHVNQGVIAGCSGGTFENIMMAAQILKNKQIGSDEFWLSVYPGSQPANLELTRNGAIATLMEAGATIRTAFCGPCFGAGDVPANNALSIRHTTRNFPSREGSKPGNGQISSVALMDARSIAATAANGGRLTAATELGIEEKEYEYNFDSTPYNNRVFSGYGKADPSYELKFGPNIADWPSMAPLADNQLLEVVSVIHDEVTTTDELIPSGETSSFRSNPLKLAEFALSRKDPEYVGRAKANQQYEFARRDMDSDKSKAEVEVLLAETMKATGINGLTMDNTCIASTIYATKPGDGSAREQAASCQRVLGGGANLAMEYATKRYRSNLVNWGMCPYIITDELRNYLKIGQKVLVPGIKEALLNGERKFKAYVIDDGAAKEFEIELPALTDNERDIILSGCLINYYANEK